MARYLYSELAKAIQARRNCDRNHFFTPTEGIKSHCADCGQIQEHKNHVRAEWFDRWTDYIDSLMEQMPSGSGFDSGTKINLGASHAEKLVFTTSFHHMNDCGMYDGWTDHTVTVTPSFSGFILRVSGRNRNDIKEYIGDTFHEALNQTVEINVR
jgi:hypothetical protein